MKAKRFTALALVLLLAAALLSPAASADPAAEGFFERFGPLLADGLDALTDWLDGQTSDLAPELRETLRGADTEALFSDLCALAAETRGMDDDALREAILALAEKHGIRLVDAQVAQLMALCRALEKLDNARLRERIDALREALDGGAAPGGLRGAWNAVVKAVTDAADWLKRTVGGWFTVRRRAQNTGSPFSWRAGTFFLFCASRSSPKLSKKHKGNSTYPWRFFIAAPLKQCYNIILIKTV